MLTIAPIQFQGLGAVALDPKTARTAVLNFKAEMDALRGKHPAGGEAVLFVEGRFDPSDIDFDPQQHTILAAARAAEFEAARARIVKDIADATGVGAAALAHVNAYPEVDVGYDLNNLIAQTGRLLKAHRDAVGAGKFPTATVILTILGVSVIGGLTVWGVTRASKNQYRRRRRRRRRY